MGVVADVISCKYEFVEMQMAPPKLYAGRQIRQLRDQAKLTQSGFAERLGISTSYLNQIENNQRSVSAAVLLALADQFSLDIKEISQGDGDRLLAALRETLADPLFENGQINTQELKIAAHNAPSVVRALISSLQAYRRNSEQLASLDESIGRSAALEPTPYEEVRDFFHFKDNYLDELDVAAERLAGKIGIGKREPGLALADCLEAKHGVRIARMGLEEKALRRFDTKAKVLHLNSYSPSETRNFQMAVQIAQMEAGATVSKLAKAANFHSSSAYEICLTGLHNYFAGALVMPYKAFLREAKELRHDLELLGAKFSASVEQVSHRLSTLQRPGSKGIPIFFARVDLAGNITKRHSAAKLQFARFGGACPLWNIHQAFETPGRFIRQLAETPDGVRYLSIATEVSKAGGGFGAQPRRYAIAIGCEVNHAEAFVYADGLNTSAKAIFDPIGISCRICERARCGQRAVPPLNTGLLIDHARRDLVPYELMEVKG